MSGLTGTDIRNLLDGTFFLGAQPNFANLEEPPDLTLADGVNDSVTRQYRPIRADWVLLKGKLVLSRAPDGFGWWIPFLGNGLNPPRGVQITKLRGLGTYACVPPDSTISWVATGPFSGCSTVSFAQPPGTLGRVFAHIITPGEGYTAASVQKQIADILNLFNNAAAPPPQQVVWDPHTMGQEDNRGYVFWTLVTGVWYRRVIFIRAADGQVRLRMDEERCP